MPRGWASFSAHELPPMRKFACARALLAAQWCLLTAVACIGGAALYAGKLPSTRYFFACVPSLFVCVRARSLSGRTELGFSSLTTISSNGSLPGPSALRLRGGFKAFWGEKRIAGFGCQEDRAVGVSEAAPG